MPKAYKVTITVEYLYDHGEEYTEGIATSKETAEAIARKEFEDNFGDALIPEYTVKVKSV